MSSAGDGGSGEGNDGGEKPFSDWMRDARPLEKGKRRASIKLTTSPPKTARSNKDGRLAERFRFPDESRPNFAASRGVSDRQLRSLATGEPPPEEKIDLHGMRQDSAREALSKRLASARSRGLRALLVVHGYGKHGTSRGTESGSVLKDGLPSWLTKPPLAGHVLAIAPAPGKLGGAGATIVLLRKSETNA